jgi:hypothetical protein
MGKVSMETKILVDQRRAEKEKAKKDKDKKKSR